jgi:hypothetical protein
MNVVSRTRGRDSITVTVAPTGSRLVGEAELGDSDEPVTVGSHFEQVGAVNRLGA